MIERTEKVVNNYKDKLKIPTSELIEDISKVKRELDNYSSALESISKIPDYSKTSRYFLDANISMREEQREMLEDMLNWRNDNEG